MNAPDLIRCLHEHRAWVNEKLLAAASQLTSEQLRQPLAIGQGSVWRSLLHLYAAEYVWLETLLGNAQATLPGDLPNKLPGNQEGAGGIANFDELRLRWRELESRWRDYLTGLTEAQLDEPVYRVSTSSFQGQRRATRRADILMHVCTHAQYTTAQVVNMLRQLGVAQLPDVMLISLARSQLAAQANPSTPPA